MVIMVATYTANLAAFFTVVAETRPVRSIEDIHESRFNAAAITALATYFQGLDNERLNQLMSAKRIAFEMVRNDSDEEYTLKHIREKLESDHIWIASSPVMKWLKQRIPDLYTLDGYFTFSAYGFALRKDWQHSERIIDQFVRFGETGFFYKIARKYEKDIQGGRKKGGNRPIGIDGFFEFFTFLFVIAAFSSCLAIAKYCRLMVLTKTRRVEEIC